ncbi:MAG: IS30 family transposase [Nocardioides sp.]
MGRPPVPIEVEREFWQRVRAGLSVVQAAAAVGVSRPTGQRLFSRSGGVIPGLIRPVGQGRYGRLSLDERHQIAALRKLDRDIGVRAMARVLGRSAATVSRELRRNANGEGSYLPAAAQARADRRARERGRAASPARLATNLRLRREVQDHLVSKHSPEQIARRLRKDHPEDPEMWVSHETIYQSLYVQGRGGLRRELTVHLRTGRVLRKPHRAADQRSRRQPRFKDEMVMISERPAEVEDRAVPGHWEGDLIMGSKESNSAVGTLVERMTRFTMLLHLPHGHTAPAVAEAMIAKMADLPDQLRRSLTWDQGAEMADHVKIAAATGLDIYFCDPHSPWQRGSNENTNGLLRQYLPKGKDLSFYGPGLLDNIAHELNGRPRKTLDWQTPAEALQELLSKQSGTDGVALTR